MTVVLTLRGWNSGIPDMTEHPAHMFPSFLSTQDVEQTFCALKLISMKTIRFYKITLEDTFKQVSDWYIDRR